jgi:hypothetical protein
MWIASAGVERTRSVTVQATPASGSYRSNPPLGGDQYAVLRLEASQRRSVAAGTVSAEVATSRFGGRYVRLRSSAGLTPRLGPFRLGISGWGGWGSRDLPPHRPFVLGGRGSLPGEPFRAWGGRYAALGRLELRFPVPFVAIPLGGFGSTGSTASLAPFIAAGWAGGPMAGAPWITPQTPRAVAGIQLDILHGLLRTELGISLHDGRTGLSVDVQRNLWPIL